MPRRDQSAPKTSPEKKGKGGMAVPALPATRNENNASWAARDLGQTWKVNPYITINPNETFTIAEIEGPGAIQHIWMTPTGVWRWSIMRIYWDDEKEPLRRMSHLRLLLHGLERVRPGRIAAHLRQSGKRLQQLLDHALPEKVQDHHREHQPVPADEPLLPGRLYP